MTAKISNRDNGSYLLIISVGYDEQGKQIVRRKTVKANSKREAEKAYVLFASEIQKGEVVFTAKLKLSEFDRRWSKEHCEKKLALKTQRSYCNHLNVTLILTNFNLCTL